MKRLFIAVPIHEKTRREIVHGIFADESVRRMPVRWIALQNLHLTVQFLGDIEEKRIPELKQVLNAVSVSSKPERFQFTGIGAFPDTKAPRIIWLGIKNIEYLLKVQSEVTKALDAKGFPVDHKRFRPHLTLGRVRENAAITPDSFSYLKDLAGKVAISDSPLAMITLYESQLRTGGSIYTSIYEKSLLPQNPL